MNTETIQTEISFFFFFKVHKDEKGQKKTERKFKKEMSEGTGDWHN